MSVKRRKALWIGFAVVGLAFALIQFVPTPPVVIPAQLPVADREAHRLLNFAGIHNFRDLGGYPAGDGRRVRWGTLYRSGTLSGATDADLAALARLDLGYLVDFRSSMEKQEAPDRLPDPPGFATVELPVLDRGNMAVLDGIMERVETGNFEGFEPDEFMVSANRQFAGQFVPEFRQFIHQVLEADGKPVAWHCSAGKDRTGFAAAILLRLLGVPDETVMADYMASEAPSQEANRTRVLLLRLFKGAEAAEKLGRMMGVDENWLQAAFDEIDERWGDFDHYVSEGLQLRPGEVARLRAALLE